MGNQGFKEDPKIRQKQVYERSNFNDIVRFYNNYIEGKPYTIAIVGNKAKIDFDKLSSYGNIIELKRGISLIDFKNKHILFLILITSFSYAQSSGVLYQWVQGSLHPTDIDYSVITHINHTFLARWEHIAL